MRFIDEGALGRLTGEKPMARFQGGRGEEEAPVAPRS